MSLTYKYKHIDIFVFIEISQLNRCNQQDFDVNNASCCVLLRTTTKMPVKYAVLKIKFRTQVKNNCFTPIVRYNRIIIFIFLQTTFTGRKVLWNVLFQRKIDCDLEMKKLRKSCNEPNVLFSRSLGMNGSAIPEAVESTKKMLVEKRETEQRRSRRDLKPDGPMQVLKVRRMQRIGLSNYMCGGEYITR